jgi:hypothetical protein
MIYPPCQGLFVFAVSQCLLNKNPGLTILCATVVVVAVAKLGVVVILGHQNIDEALISRNRPTSSALQRPFQIPVYGASGVSSQLRPSKCSTRRD